MLGTGPASAPSTVVGTSPMTSEEAPPMTADRPTSVIVAGARTPMGRLLGSLKPFSGAGLGGSAIRGAREKAAGAPERVGCVIMGRDRRAGAGQIPARRAAHAAG